MKPEGGVTEFSLENARELLRLRGKPRELHFLGHVGRGDYYVTAVWYDGSRFCFSGFAWGYGGTACQGLDQFLALLGITTLNSELIPIDQHGKISVTFSLQV